MNEQEIPRETVTLGQAGALIAAMAHERSLLLLSPPGIGKSDLVADAAASRGLECRSLLGTQIAPEDVSGIPRIVGDRSVFCPPRVLLPETPEPFCLFLDELPATAPDVQKAFYSLLLERRVGEHQLPPGTWVVAAGNRVEDRALVRSLSSALVNRVLILHLRVDQREWLAWAARNGVRSEIVAFILFQPLALARPVPAEPVPFSTPRSWASLSRALDLAEAAMTLTTDIVRALAFGSVSSQDAAVFCAMQEGQIEPPGPLHEYLSGERPLPDPDTARWFVLHHLRVAVRAEHRTPEIDAIPAAAINTFLSDLPQEHRFALLVDLVREWSALGADEAMYDSLREVTGL